MASSLSCPPSNTQGLAQKCLSTHSSQKSVKPQELFHEGLVSKNSNTVNSSSSSNKIHQNNPMLMSADTSMSSSTTSTRRTGKKTYYTNDQILVLIKEQLEKYRAQMKKLKETGSSNSQTYALPSSSQGTTSNSSASCGVRKATENSVDKAKGEIKPSEIIRTNPERTQLKSPRTESSTGYVMQERAAVSTMEKEVVFRTLSDPPLGELVKESPNLAHQKPSNQVQSVSENISDRNDLCSTGRDAGKDVDNSPNDSSVLNKLKFSNQQTSVPENQTQLSFLKAKEHRPFSPAGGDHFTLSCLQSLDVVRGGEPEQKTQMEKEVQSDAGIDIELGLWVSQDTVAEYEDITDDEACSESTQGLTHSSKSQVGVAQQSDEQFNVNLNAIENVQSEDESDSEDVVLFVTELFLKDEIIAVDSDEPEADVSSSEPNKQNMFRKIPEYETFDTFYQSNIKLHKNFPNPLKAEQDPAAPEHDADSHSDADDRCDRDDSLDDSSHTKSKHLTVSDGVSAQSPLSGGSSGEEKDDVLSSPTTIEPSVFSKKVKTGSISEDELLNNSVNCAKSTADPKDSKPLHMKAKCKSRDSGRDQEKMKKSVPDSNGFTQQGPQPQNSPSASRNLQLMNQNLSIKGKFTNTKKNEEKGQRKTFQDLQEKAPESRVNSHPGHEVNAQSAKRKMSQDNPECAPASERISSGKKQQQTTNASNIRTTQQVQPTPKMSVSQGQPTLQNPPTTHKSSLNSNEVNSYSTVRSTPAKQELVRQWSQIHITIPKERRSSLKADGKRKAQNQNISSQRPPRKKLRTPNLETSLMKKSKREAQQRTKAVHTKEAPRQSIDKSSGERYKWRKELPLMKLGDGWLEEMHGEPYRRP